MTADERAWKVYGAWDAHENRESIIASIAAAIREAEADATLVVYHNAWVVLHESRPCGHPRACWLDKNYPASEQNYSPETFSGEPPVDYRCIVCEAEADATKAERERCAKTAERVGMGVRSPFAEYRKIAGVVAEEIANCIRSGESP